MCGSISRQSSYRLYRFYEITLDRVTKEKRADLVYRRRSRTDKRVNSGVRSLQALARGRKARSMNPNAPVVSGIACSECEYKPAVKRCFDCQDCFCFLCFDNFHYKGNRANHQFEILTQEGPSLLRSRSGAMSVEGNVVGEGSSTYPSSMARNPRNVEPVIEAQAIAESSHGPYYAEWNYGQSPQDYYAGQTNTIGQGDMSYGGQTDGDQFYNEYYTAENQEWLDPNLYWQEYFDEGAQAKYWFNTWTGEATWVYPFAVEEPS